MPGVTELLGVHSGSASFRCALCCPCYLAPPGNSTLSPHGHQYLCPTLHGQLPLFGPKHQAPLGGSYPGTAYPCQAAGVLEGGEASACTTSACPALNGREPLLTLPVLLKQSPHLLPQFLQWATEQNKPAGKGWGYPEFVECLSGYTKLGVSYLASHSPDVVAIPAIPKLGPGVGIRKIEVRGHP